MSEEIGDFIFIVDTNSYAGNFEREMTAFCTGQYGECGVGEETADAFFRDHPDMADDFASIISHVPDEHGCHRPTSIWTTPGWWNDGMGNEWPDSMRGTPEALAEYRRSLEQYLKSSSLTGADQEVSPEPGRYPAYLSVAMFFGSEPSQEMLDFMMGRAHAFKTSAARSKPDKILGFRLTREVVVRSEQLLWHHP